MAQSIGNMSYDKIAELYKELENEFQRQSEKDFNRGRTRLSKLLKDASIKQRESLELFKNMWSFSEKYSKIMK